MPRRILIAALVALLAWSPMAEAEQRNLVLEVENMFCSLCEATVRRAVEAVPGVVAVEVDRENGLAAVVYDDALASPEELAAAITEAGYPASPTQAAADAGGDRDSGTD